MRMLLHMDNGKSVKVEGIEIDNLFGQFKNQGGVMINGFIKLTPTLIINPSHISTIEITEE